VTVVAIHQPNYLPWLGFFAKAMDCDVLVLYDNIQFEKRGYTSRVRIKSSQGVQWLTEPVLVHGRAYQDIQDVMFAEPDWPRRHLKCIQLNYARAAYFEAYFGQLAELLCAPGSNLSGCNERLIRWACEVLQLKPVVVRASDLASEVTDPTQRLIALVRAVGGDTYLSGSGGFAYQDVDEFERAGLRVVRGRSVFPEYPQLWGDFCHGLSIVDLLFNCGPASRSLLEKGTWRD
jgi:WbqC-like protein family